MNAINPHDLLEILRFRIVSRKMVGLGSGPKAITYGKCVTKEGGICHASRDKLWSTMQPFAVPKGSPLHASIILYVNGYTVHTRYSAIGYSAKSDKVPTLTHMRGGPN